MTRGRRRPRGAGGDCRATCSTTRPAPRARAAAGTQSPGAVPRYVPPSPRRAHPGRIERPPRAAIACPGASRRVHTVPLRQPARGTLPARLRPACKLPTFARRVHGLSAPGARPPPASGPCAGRPASRARKRARSSRSGRASGPAPATSGSRYPSLRSTSIRRRIDCHRGRLIPTHSAASRRCKG